MDIRPADDLVHTPDLVHRLRRLHFFRQSFHRTTAALAQRSGRAVSIDDARLTNAFLNWADEISRQRSAAAIDRKDFIFFAAGLLLRELMGTQPLTPRPRAAAPAGSVADAGSTADMWPEGFLCTGYCICVLEAILEQDMHEHLRIAPDADDLRTWWSFRENVREDPSLAIAFLDVFLGNEPNWTLPDQALHRPAMQRALALRQAGVTPAVEVLSLARSGQSEL